MGDLRAVRVLPEVTHWSILSHPCIVASHVLHLANGHLSQRVISPVAPSDESSIKTQIQDTNQTQTASTVEAMEGLAALDAYEGKALNILPSGSYSLGWRFTESHWEVVLVAETDGYVALGIAEQTSGSMPGSDIVIATVTPEGTPMARDYYATSKSTPTLDCHQDWEITSGIRKGKMLIVELRRKIDTNDPQDRALVESVQNLGRPWRFIIATGPLSDPSSLSESSLGYGST